MAKTSSQKLSYTEAIEEIERILAKMDSRQMDVDALAAEVKRAAELIAQCKKRLYKAEKDVAAALQPEGEEQA